MTKVNSCDSGVTFRYNPNKAGSTEIGLRSWHGTQDSMDACARLCNDLCIPCLKDIEQDCNDGNICCATLKCSCCLATVALCFVAISFFAGATSFSKDCIEVCTYANNGMGICKCLF